MRFEEANKKPITTYNQRFRWPCVENTKHPKRRTTNQRIKGPLTSYVSIPPTRCLRRKSKLHPLLFSVTVALSAVRETD